MTLDKVDLSGWDSNKEAATVPEGWTQGTTISVIGETFNPPVKPAAAVLPILTTDTEGYFANAAIADNIAYKAVEGGFHEQVGGVTLEGQQSKGVKSEGKNLVYADNRSINSITLGTVTYEKDAIVIDGSSSAYDYSGAATLNTANFAVDMTTAQAQNSKAGDVMTLVKGNATMPELTVEETGKITKEYTYNPAGGMTVDATLKGSAAVKDNNVIYTINENKASNIAINSAAWANTYNRPDTESEYKEAVVDTNNITFTGVEKLSKGEEMTLVNNFGAGIYKVEGGVFALDNGATGIGHAYWKDGQLYYSIDLGSDETGVSKDAIDESSAAVSGETKTGNVIGGEATGDGVARANQAGVTGAVIKRNADGTGGDVIGGLSEKGTAEKNTATVKDSTVEGNVYGGRSYLGAVLGNTANVTGGTVDGNVYGARTDGKDMAADTNTVLLDGGAVVNGGVFGGYSANGSATGNTVTIKNAFIRDYIYGGKSKNKSQNDQVFFEDGSVLGIIGGGCVEAVNNTAELNDGMVREHIFGGFADKTATGNIVNLNGGTVTGSVIGGYAADTADGNTIYLSGGTVQGTTITSNVLGGITIPGGVYGGYTSGTGTTQNNSVYLYKTADVASTSLYGGNKEATGNNLYVGMLLKDGTPSAWTGGSQSTQNITNFENINFTAVPWSTTQAALTITDGTNSDLSMSNVSAAQVAFTGVKVLAKDDTMTLLDQSKVTADKQAANVTADSHFTVGSAIEGTGKLSKDDNGNVLYKVESVSSTEQTHNTVMGAAAAMTALSAGNDFIGAATEGLSLKENIGDDGVGCYAKIGRSHMKQETGSHVNVNTWNAILALGHKNVQKKSTVEYGAFFEYGKGNYATSNNGLRGDGSVDYTGGGLLGKWKKDNGFYVEGSFRAGTVNEDARNLLHDNVRSYSYNTSANYMGFHIGVGKQIAVANGNVVDVYGKYFYNRKNGVDFTVNGDDYKLDDVTSQIFRIGARYTMKREKWNFYGDAAYEHELDGKAGGRVNGVGLRSADTKGGSFRLELGAELRPDNKTPWSLNLNVTGYAGKKQGVQGGISLKYMF